MKQNRADTRTSLRAPVLLKHSLIVQYALMPNRILILGAGTGGTLIANKLRRHYGAETEITVVDKDDRHVYQPDLLFVPFGLVAPNSICRPRSKQLRKGIEFRLGEIERVETEKSTVHLADGETLPPPKARCIHTCLIPSSAHSRMVASAVSGLVPITTASTPPGIDFRSG